MASQKQVSANRCNAAKSTGPKTQNEKLQSRRNAMRHGLTAATVVTASEDAEEFEWFGGRDHSRLSAAFNDRARAGRKTGAWQTKLIL
jgi:hypothetical protein